MKYKVRITKQPKYQDGGSRTLGDFSNLTEDQLENGLVYGFRPEPEIQLEHPLNNIERLSDVPAPLIPVSKPEIRGISVDIPSSVSKSKYAGVSIVDYLNSIGLPSSFKYRKELAKINNIENYTGTAAQNKQLISILDNLKHNFIDFGKNKPVVKNNVIRHVGANNNAEMADIATNRLRYFANQKEMADIADKRLNYYRFKPQIPVAFDSYIQGVPQKFIKQEGGEQDQQQIMQVIQAYAQKSGVDPKAILLQLQKMQPEEQQQALIQMHQELQGDESQNYDMGYDTPMAAYGGQMGYGLDLGARRLWMNQDDDESSQINDLIEEVPRDEANIEAEGGETALIPNEGDQGYTHKKIKGNRHTEGGVPLNVPEGTFIYSDTKKMKLGGPVLKMFGKSEKSTKKFTPATLAKQYNLDKYRAILEDDKSDPIAKRTAELMIQNYEKKLAQLALVQEGKKGFPQGIPQVSQSYYQQMMQAQQGEEQEMQQEVPQQAQAMYGMGFKYGGGLQKFQGDKGSSEFRGVPYAYNEPMYTTNDFSGRQYNKTSESTLPEIKIPDLEMEKPEYLDKPKKPFQFNDIYGPTFVQPESKSIDPSTVSHTDPNIRAIEYEPWNESKKEEKNKENKYITTNYNIPYGWTTPDKLNMLNSMINLASVRRSTPFEPTVQFQRPQTYYTDPSRALAANAEQMNAARQAAGMFAGPQSRYSFNAGQFGKNAADIIGQYAMQNVGLGNQAAQQNAAINNQQIQYDAQRAKRLYDAGVIGEQQYQNAMRQARAAVLQSYTQGSENAANLYNLSSTQSPYFAYDPSKRTIYFRSEQARKDFFDPNKQNKNDDYFEMMDRLMNDYSMSADKAAERASQRFGKQQMSKDN